MKGLLQALALTLSYVGADHGYSGQMTYNTVSVPGVKVGKETQTTQGEQTDPIANPDTVLDETTFTIDVEYATVFNKAVE